jgi:hypothetical protein
MKWMARAMIAIRAGSNRSRRSKNHLYQSLILAIRNPRLRHYQIIRERMKPREILNDKKTD